MTHVIGSLCTKDTKCVDVCPVDCIHPRKDEAGFEEVKQLYIDPETCIDCGLCVDECPESTIWPEEELPPEQQPFTQINADYYKKK